MSTSLGSVLERDKYCFVLLSPPKKIGWAGTLLTVVRSKMWHIANKWEALQSVLMDTTNSSEDSASLDPAKP